MPAIDFGLRINVKSLFFDRGKVMRAVSRAERRVLSRAGAFVRTRARSSIKRRKSISRPGKPPSSHEGGLKRLIFFAYQPRRHAVVIGPVRFNQKHPPQGVPALLEFGGTVVDRQERRIKRYRPRPYMGPALQAEAPKFPDLWRNSVKAA